MRNVRMTLPEYISNVTLFKQAEKILINKSIINEIKVNEAKVEEIEKYDPTNYIKNIIKRYEDSNDSMSNILAGLSGAGINHKVTNAEPNVIKWYYDGNGANLSGEIKVNESLNEANTDGLKQMGYSNSDIEDFMDEWKQGGSKLPKKVKDYLDGLYNTKLGQLKTKPLREVKDESATGYYNQDGKEQYGKFDELDNMNAQEIMAGYVMEKQDNPDIDQKEAVKLVIKNLKKDQFYYTNYKLTGIRDVKPTEFLSTKRKPFFDQMEELDKKGTNLIDEKNKMVVVKEGLEKYESDNNFSESQKSKLKEMVRKMMKEMFDGRDNLTAVVDVSNYDNVDELDSAKLIKKYYAPVQKPDEKFLLSLLSSTGEAMIKNVGNTTYYDYPGSFMKDLQSGKIKEVPFY
jgi:hypothetical protein